MFTTSGVEKRTIRWTCSPKLRVAERVRRTGKDENVRARSVAVLTESSSASRQSAPSSVWSWPDESPFAAYAVPAGVDHCRRWVRRHDRPAGGDDPGQRAHLERPGEPDRPSGEERARAEAGRSLLRRSDG